MRWLLCAVACVVFLASIVGSTSTHTVHDDNGSEIYADITAVSDLIDRVMSRASTDSSCGAPPAFSLSIVEADSDDVGDAFTMWSSEEGTTVYLEATSGVALASGFHWYLKHSCNCSVSWLGDQLCLPLQSTYVARQTVQSPYQYGYYMNTCTLGYSTVWWNWDRWEQEIDWMAMNGVNLPLAFVGQEYVWQEVWGLLGIPAEDLFDFFGGPAFLPWQRMGNEDGWPIPLPQSWMRKQRDLQIQLLDRMRSFGMKPILPGFSGHVPVALKKYYPDAAVTQLASWSDGFNGTYFLDPFDPLFATIGALFIQELEATYGTDHFYNSDPFNEEIPPSSDPDYLSQVAKTIYSSMATTDPEAVWVLQGWFLVSNPDFWGQAQAQAFLDAVDDSHMLILDLWAEVEPIWSTGMFFGKPFVWNMLQNFGGRPGMHASLASVAAGPPAALSNASSSVKIVGTGYTPEAIETNPVAYDLMSEMHWQITAPDVTKWIQTYTIRRYGIDNSDVKEAWNLLQNSVFACQTTQMGPTGIVAGVRPDLQMDYAGCCTSMEVYWDPQDVCTAWTLLIGAADILKGSDTYGNDIVQVTLQVLASVMSSFHKQLVASFFMSDSPQFEDFAQKILDILADMDTLLATQQPYLLGKWLADAKAWAQDEAEALNYQYNARLQVTQWGYPLTDLNDYAYKMWAGLTRTYQTTRWQTFINSLRDSIDDPQTWKHSVYMKRVSEAEQAWTLQFDDWNYSTQTVGDSTDVAVSMYEKYNSYC
ncbi:alpha-N-acetylglucosaminidase precursor [Pelomyxa schiedti]|nr:alpha-N-acetylglucosaminidase precursor [Pelomyxa schiedti]